MEISFLKLKIYFCVDKIKNKDKIVYSNNENIVQFKKELKAKIDIVFYILENDIIDNQAIENLLISISKITFYC